MRRWLAAVLGAVLLAGACGATTTTTLETTAFPAASFLVPRVLEPGRHHTTTMTPLVTADFGEGWTLLGEFPPLLLLSRTVGPDRQQDFLNFVTFPVTERAAVAGIIRSVEGVVAGEPEERVIGGRDATEFTVDIVVEVEVFAFPKRLSGSRRPCLRPEKPDVSPLIRLRFPACGR